MLAVAAVAWGGNFVVGRAVHAEFPPVGLAFWRWTAAAAILLPFTLGEALRCRRVIRANLSALLTTAFFGLAVFHTLVYVSLNTTTAINGALVLAPIPATTPVIARLILGAASRRARPSG